MNIVVCLDYKNGMLFNKRRQSSDRKLRERIFEIIGDNKLYMNSYSAKQFTEKIDKIIVADDFLSIAGTGDFCFAESLDFISFYDKIEDIIIYRWNRIYPSDVKFPVDDFLNNRHLADMLDFAGSSHEKITEEIYRL